MLIHSVNFAPEDLAAKRSGRNFTITAKRGHGQLKLTVEEGPEEIRQPEKEAVSSSSGSSESESSSDISEAKSHDDSNDIIDEEETEEKLYDKLLKQQMGEVTKVEQSPSE